MARKRQIKPETRFFPKRLMERLELIKSYPLTLIEAPSGFGKTTALRHFFDSKIPDTAFISWHTFSFENPKSSWKAFCGLIYDFDPKSGTELESIGLPDEDNMSRIKDAFRNLLCPEETYIVLDDFASWKLAKPVLFLEALSNHGGIGLHIVVASQLLQWEGQSTLLPSSRFHLIRESALAFSRSDIDAYYRQAGISLTGMQLEELEKITEGWIMALYLQLLAYINSDKFEVGSMEDLIHKALWDKLPEKEKKFLLAVSIFPGFSLAQATAMSGMTPAETESLLRGKRVFVHFDRESRRFYLHTLFRSFLAQQFTLLTEEKKKIIYIAGGDLAEQADDRINTLRFYYLSGSWERLMALTLTSYEIADIADENTKPMILDIIDNTPYEIKLKYPASMVPLAFTLFFLHENEKLLTFKEEILEIINESALSQVEKNALLGEMELLLSFLEYNRIDAMSARHRKALKLLGGPAALINIKSTWTFGSPSVLYLYYREKGKLDAELMQMDECMPYYYSLTRGHGSGAEIIMRGEAHFLRGELDMAEMLCHKAMFTADSKRQSSIYQCGLFLLARIAIFCGDKNMLNTALQSMEERARQNTEDLCRYTLDLIKGFLYILLGNKSEIAPWLSEGDINDKRLVIMAQPFAHIIYGRILLEQKQYHKILGVSEFALAISSIFPNLLPQIYIKLYMGQALEALGKHSEAIDCIKDALSIALPDNIYIPFAENYTGIKNLLPKAGCSSEALEKIVYLADMLKSGLANLGQGDIPLTPREAEVLLLIKEGLSNTVIAERLNVSVSTIKAAVSIILNKKGVTSREMLKG